MKVNNAGVVAIIVPPSEPRWNRRCLLIALTTITKTIVTKAKFIWLQEAAHLGSGLSSPQSIFASMITGRVIEFGALQRWLVEERDPKQVAVLGLYGKIRIVL